MIQVFNQGTKFGEYLLEFDENDKLHKVPFDERKVTLAQNTVKLPRYGRMKNEGSIILCNVRVCITIS